MHRYGTETHASSGGPFEHLVHRVVFEHQQVVENRLAAEPRPALQLEQRRVLLFAQRQVLPLQPLQQFVEGHLWSQRYHHRQGIDEQPDLVLDTRQIGRTPGDGGAEDHGVLSGIALQEQRPARLDQGIESDLVAPGEIPEPRGSRCVHLTQVLSDAVGRCQSRLSQCLDQSRRLVQSRHLLAPECLGSCRVLPLQPGDVVAIAAIPGLLRRASGIGLQHLAEQLGIAPSVQQDVMMGVDQVVLTFGSLHQQQPQQWRTLQFETAFALGRSQREQRGVPIRRLAQVLFGEGQLALSIDDLQGLLQLPLPGETTAQDRVPVQGGLPGCAEARDIEAGHIHTHLIDVVARCLLVQRMEQHALLHG